MTETFWDRHGLYGLMAQFETPEQILAAAQRAHDAGYRKMEAYSPMPIDGLAEAVGFKRNWVSFVVLCRRTLRLRRRLRPALVDRRHRLSAQCRRPSLR